MLILSSNTAGQCVIHLQGHADSSSANYIVEREDREQDSRFFSRLVNLIGCQTEKSDAEVKRSIWR